MIQDSGERAGQSEEKDNIPFGWNNRKEVEKQSRNIVWV